MMAPRGIVGASLVAWGYAIGMPIAGILMAAAFELVRLAALHAEIPARRITYLARLCLLAVLGMLGYFSATQNFPEALYSWLGRLPFVLFPLPLMQAFAGGALSRRPLAEATRRGAGAWVPQEDVDVTHLFVAVTLVAAGMGTSAQAWLYAAYAGIVLWVLAVRLAPSRRAAGVAMMAAGAGLGYGVHVGVHELQAVVEELGDAINQPEPDPFRERTRIGDIGRIKLGDRIVMRVSTDRPIAGALLLREAAYDTYGGGQWRAQSMAGSPVARNGTTWTIGPGEATSQVSVRRWLSNGEGLLPLPLASRTVASLAAQSLERLPLGSLRVRGAPKLLAITATFDAAAPEVAAATPNDLAIPPALAGTLERVLVQEGLRRATAAETLAAIRAFFDAKFAYSLQLSESTGSRSIEDFLLKDRRGHCEYFATATALLLRQAGIPARYVGGYSVSEWSALERAYVVRTRHAHAWASANVDGGWRFVDTTPARWAEIEREEARSVFGPLLDRLYWAWDRVLEWMNSLSAEDALQAAGGLVASLAGLVLIYVAWRRWRARRGRQRKLPRDDIGLAWDRIEARIARRGLGRAPAETLGEWRVRLAGDARAAGWLDAWLPLAAAYESARYDPAADRSVRGQFIRDARGFDPGG